MRFPAPVHSPWTKPSPRRLHQIAALTLLGLVAGNAPGRAADGTWANNTGDADALWSTTSNWVSGSVPGVAGVATANADVATFPAAASVEIPILDGDRRLGGLSIDNTQADYSLGSLLSSNVLFLQNAAQLTITGGGVTTINPVLRVGIATPTWNTGATDLTLTNGLSIGSAASTTFTLTNSSAVKVLGAVTATVNTTVLFSGAGSMNISGNITSGGGGTLTFGSAATFTGTFTLSGTNTVLSTNWRSGSLVVANAAAWQNNVILGTTSTSTAVSFLTAGAFTYTGAISEAASAVTANMTIGGNQTSGTSIFSGTVTMNNTNRTAGWNLTAAAGGTVVFSNTIAGVNTDDKITKVGNGTVQLTKSTGNTYIGGTTVSAGKLEITNTSNSATGTGAVLVSGGVTATLGGTGIATGATTVTNGSRIAPGVNTTGANGNFGVVGALSLGTTDGLSLNGTNTANGANLDFDLTATAAGAGSALNDQIGTSTLTLGTGVKFTFNGINTPTLDTSAPYTLIATTGAVSGFNTGNISTTFLGGLSGLYTAAYSVDANDDLVVSFTAVPEPGTLQAVAGGVGILVSLQRFRRRKIR